MLRPVAVALGLLLLAGQAVAGPTRLAVLELAGDLDRPILSTLTDQVRAGALNAVAGSEILVMTRENMAAMAREMGLDLSCAEVGAECQLDVARNIGADLVVSGEIARFGPKAVVATIKLHDTRSGALVGTETLQEEQELHLVAGLRVAAERLLREWSSGTRRAANEGGTSHSPAAEVVKAASQPTGEPSAQAEEGALASWKRVAWGDERHAERALSRAAAVSGFHLTYVAVHPGWGSEHEVKLFGKAMVRMDLGGELKVAVAQDGKPSRWLELGERLGARWGSGPGSGGNKMDLWYDGEVLLIGINGLSFGPYRVGRLGSGPWEIKLTKGVELRDVRLDGFEERISGRSAAQLAAAGNATGQGPLVGGGTLDLKRVVSRTTQEAAAFFTAAGEPARHLGFSYRAHHPSSASEHDVVLFGTFLLRVDRGGELKVAELRRDKPSKKLEAGKRLGALWSHGPDSARNEVRVEYESGRISVEINGAPVGSYRITPLVAAPWQFRLTDDGAMLEELRLEGL